MTTVPDVSPSDGGATDRVGDSTDPVIFQDVHKRFGSLHVLQGISGRVGMREVVVICGPSGSGKSTLLRCINKLETIDSGQVYVLGKPVHEPRTDVNALRTEIGMVFQIGRAHV